MSLNKLSKTDEGLRSGSLRVPRTSKRVDARAGAASAAPMDPPITARGCDGATSLLFSNGPRGSGLSTDLSAMCPPVERGIAEARNFGARRRRPS